MHGIKFYSVVIPNGIIANLFDPAEGCRHDSSMLAYSGLLQQLGQHFYKLSLHKRSDFLRIWSHLLKKSLMENSIFFGSVYQEPMCIRGNHQITTHQRNLQV